MDGGIVGAGQVPSPRGLGLVTGIKHRDEMELSAGASQVHGFNTDPPHRFNAISSPLAHHALCEGQVYYSGLGQDKIPTSVCFSLIIFSLCRTALSQIRTIVLSSTTPLSVRKESAAEGKCASKRPPGGDEEHS